MAYFYGTPRNPGSNYNYDVRDMCYSIADFLEGSDWRNDAKATGTTGFNGSAGNYAGTNPTSGIYHTISASGGSASGQVIFYKKHYATGQTAGYTPSYKIIINVDAADGWRVNVYDDNGNNSTPTSSTSVGIGGNTNAGYNRVGGAYGAAVKAIHMIANDTTFMFKVSASEGFYNGGTDTDRDHGWFVLNDLEYAPTIDNWAYSVDDTYCPSVLIHSAWMNVMDNPVPAETNSNYAHFGVGQPRYIDYNGVVRTAEFSPHNANFHFGVDHTSSRQYSTISPPPALNQEHFNVSGGDAPIHQLTPVQFIGHHSLRLAGITTATAINKNPRRGRMMNMYRISDNAGDDGDVILEGTTRYRIVKPHKCGYVYGYEADVNACYAFPEDNVPYA
tara:strand:+ start:12604 stop:13770 length:1167 start_codon:yes stop_codon:yes gene_type:complete